MITRCCIILRNSSVKQIHGENVELFLKYFRFSMSDHLKNTLNTILPIKMQSVFCEHKKSNNTKVDTTVGIYK